MTWDMTCCWSSLAHCKHHQCLGLWMWLGMASFTASSESKPGCCYLMPARPHTLSSEHSAMNSEARSECSAGLQHIRACMQPCQPAASCSDLLQHLLSHGSQCLLYCGRQLQCLILRPRNSSSTGFTLSTVYQALQD